MLVRLMLVLFPAASVLHEQCYCCRAEKEFLGKKCVFVGWVCVVRLLNVTPALRQSLTAVDRGVWAVCSR